MPTTGSHINISCVSPRVYVVKYGPKNVLFIEHAKVILRRGGRRLGSWLKYLIGKVFGTGEKAMICLGQAIRNEISEWILTSNGEDLMYAYRMLEQMMHRLGSAKCLAIALLALKED